MSARDLARRVLSRVEEGAYASLALAAEIPRARLDESDRALCTELVYGVLRLRSRLDRALAACTTRGDLSQMDVFARDALRVGAYQILFLRVPAHAAVDDAVESVKKRRGAKLAGFVNAVLRRLARDGEPATPPIAEEGPVDAAWVEAVAIAESTPAWIVEEAARVLPPAEARAFLAASNRAAPVWLRTNLGRTSRDELSARLAVDRPRARFATSDVVPEALAVTQGGEVFSTSAHAEGLFAAQDLGAQAIARLLAPEPGDLVLDACAGVGGKSTHLAQLAGGKANIDAADLSARKLELGADLAHRLGLAGIRAVTADLTDRAAPLRPDYDRVLLDAPCSGLGVLRRHPELKWRRTAADVAGLAELQRRLLEALASRVRPGGVLVYAVCTFTIAEGPGQVRAFLAAHPEFMPDPAPDSLAAFALRDGLPGELRTWPQRDDADAFYAARLRRRA